MECDKRKGLWENVRKEQPMKWRQSKFIKSISSTACKSDRGDISVIMYDNEAIEDADVNKSAHTAK